MTTTAPERSSKTPGIVAALLIAAVVVAIIVALALGGTGDEPADAAAADAAHIPTSGTLRQVSSVATVGDALPRLDLSNGIDEATGAAAPAVTASRFDNSEVTIDFSDGQPRAVLFFAHWCPHCQQEVKDLVQRFEQSGVPTNVELVAISTNVDQGAPNYPPSAWFLNEGWPVPVLRDSASNDLAQAFGLSGFPFMVTVDGQGQIVERRSGAVPSAQFDAMLSAAANS